MSSNIAKSPHGYLAEFHCHTCRSHDGLTTEEELLKTCVAKRIGLLTITEHDRVPDVDVRRFQDAGVHVIAGCEFTCERGSHIIGLFIRDGLEMGRSAHRIFQHILNQGGLVMIPHPFKPGSGFCTLYPDHRQYMSQVSLMEAYNGGLHQEDERVSEIRALCSDYDIKLVAASDAHRANHVGYYVTAYPALVQDDWRETLSVIQGTLLVDSAYARKPRSLTPIQENHVYQEIIVRVPSAVKQFIKRCLYRWRNRHYEPSVPSYITLP